MCLLLRPAEALYTWKHNKMANNFRIAGDYYLSKAGSDANAGTTGDLPKQTIGGAAAVGTNGQTLVIGSGYYAENFTLNRVLSGDGNVVIAGTGSNAATIYSANNIIFVGHGSITTAGTVNITNCEFRNCTVRVNSIGYISNCKFINCTLVQVSNGLNGLNNCILINSPLPLFFVNMGGGSVHQNNYADFSSTITVANQLSAMNCNDFEGGIIVNQASAITSGVIQDINGKYYDLSITGSGGTGAIGTPYQRGNTLGASFLMAAHKVAYTMNANSISAPPLFNAVSKLDFTLQSNSPLIGTGVSGSNITSANVATASIASDDADFTAANGAFINGLSGTTDLTVTSGSGLIVLPPKLYSTSIREVGIVRYVGALTFNKSVTPPNSTNQNVPDAQVFAGADASGGGNPDRLVFEMRWSSSASVVKILKTATTISGNNVVSITNTSGLAVGQEISGAGIPLGSLVTSVNAGVSVVISNNATASATITTLFTDPTDWDNNGFAAGGSYTKFQWNAKPNFDSSGKSNADPAFNAATALSIGATYYQMKITLTNSYS
jgi:hypothetical protein